MRATSQASGQKVEKKSRNQKKKKSVFSYVLKCIELRPRFGHSDVADYLEEYLNKRGIPRPEGRDD